MSFFTNLLEYMHTNNSNIAIFDKVIAKLKWCCFFASQCIFTFDKTEEFQGEDD